MTEYVSKAELARRFNIPRSRVDMIQKAGQLAGMTCVMGQRTYIDAGMFGEAFGYADTSQQRRVISWRT